MLEGVTRFEAMQMVEVLTQPMGQALHPGRLTWNLLNNHLERKIIFQTSMVMFHGNLPGCKFGGKLVWEIQLIPMEIQGQFPFMKSNEVQGIQWIQGQIQGNRERILLEKSQLHPWKINMEPKNHPNWLLQN